MAKPSSIEQYTLRFWTKVKIGEVTECWLWSRSVDRFGYGQIAARPGFSRKAHRVAWELTNGPIPDGMLVCHACDVPGCVNPNHLWLGTHKDNQRDKAAKGRNAGGPHPDSCCGEDNNMAILTWEKVREIRSLYGIETQLQISKKFGVSRETISDLHRGRRWYDPDWEPKKRGVGKDHPSAKLTPEIIKEIRSNYPNMTMESIANKFNLGTGHISRIINRVIWKSVE